jgi:hypothetical protein
VTSAVVRYVCGMCRRGGNFVCAAGFVPVSCPVSAAERVVPALVIRLGARRLGDPAITSPRGSRLSLENCVRNNNDDVRSPVSTNTVIAQGISASELELERPGQLCGLYLFTVARMAASARDAASA